MNRDHTASGVKALVVGWYGAPNVGDEVLLTVLKRRIGELGGTLMVVSADPALTRRMHGTDAVDFNNLGEIAGALQWADVLVMGGGGIFQDHHPFRLQGIYDPVLSDIAAYARPVLMARQFGVPVVIWGHGVGPLRKPDSRDVVRDVFNGATAVSVRDDESLQLLREIGVDRAVEVGPDPGWLYARYCAQRDTLQPGKDKCGKKTLALVVREWGGDWKDKLVDAIQSMTPDSWSIMWVAFQANISESGATSDLAILEELRERAPAWAKGQLLTPTTPDEAWAILSDADAIMSMRLHASILGLSARKPVAGLEYDEKMARAHAMAGMPSVLRVAVGDPVERYTQAMVALLDDGAWSPSEERIVSLEDQATVHLKLLDTLREFGGGSKRWSAGHYDWLGTWLQQSLADLRATKLKSQRAHDLLAYRDYELSERGIQLETAKARIAELDREAARAAELQEQLTQAEASVERLQHTFDGYRKSTQDQMTEKDLLCERQKGDLNMLERDLAALGEQMRTLQIQLQESVDELRHKDSYIEDKEIYIAQLVSRVAQLEVELAQTQTDLAAARKTWPRVTGFFSVVRRGVIRVAVAPFKLVRVWRRHGLRVALQQALWRMSTLGRRGTETLGMAEVAGGSLTVRPARAERLLIIGDMLQEEGGWPSRAASLAMAGDRAGFFVRVWQVGSATEPAASEPRLARLLTTDVGLLQEVRGAGTRILLASLATEALATAQIANARGAEIILDLSSVDLSMLDAGQLEAISAKVSRAVSRDGTRIPHLDGLEISRLLDAGDNEEFDSYKTYPYPEEYRKRRRNILLVVDEVDAQPIVRELASQLPHDHILVAGGAEIDSGLVRAITLTQSRLASLLAAADVVLVANGGKVASLELRALVNAALLLERRVVTDAQFDGLLSKNLHPLGQMSWPVAAASSQTHEDYQFVSRNCWLGRVEELMRGEFPLSVSVIVLIHNNRNIIERCLSTMLEHCGEWLCEIVVVDNQSSDGGAELVEELYGRHPKVKLVRNSENGCSSGRNLGVKESHGKYIAFFDSDQWLTAPSSFAEAIHILEAGENVGAIGWNAGWFDATRSDLGGAISDYVPMRGMNAAAHAKGYRDDIGFLGTSGMFMRRDLFDRIDGFDTFYDPTCFEDTDICFQIKKAGYAVVLRDLAGIRHQPHQTTGASAGSERYRKLFNRNAEYFRRKWADHPEFFVDYST